jgi:cobalamin biosynthesis protein CobD/CbiB
VDTDGWVTERRLRYFPDTTAEVRAPAGPLRLYGRVAHMPHPLVGITILVALVALVGTRRNRAELLLLLGVALAILVGSTATSAFVLRYAVPLYPLFVCAGVLGAWALLEASRDRREHGAPRGALAVTRRARSGGGA